MTEEFHDAQEYIADDKIKEFDIKQKKIYKIDKSKFIIKLIAKELIQESDTWIYNRKINIYIHRDGKCIYTNKEYNNDIHDFESNITSYNMDYVIYDKNPFSIEELNQYIYRTHGIQINLFDKIAELMTLVGRACISHIKKSSNIKNATTYQLFGADIILDNNFVPYLLEINKGPDMRIRCDRDKILKEKVYRDIYGTLGIIKSEENRFIRLNI